MVYFEKVSKGKNIIHNSMVVRGRQWWLIVRKTMLVNYEEDDVGKLSERECWLIMRKTMLVNYEENNVG